MVCNGSTFWDLMDDLLEEYREQDVKNGYYGYRVSIIEYFKKCEVYVQKLDKKVDDNIKLWHGNFVPAFCVYNPEESVVFIWTRKDWRLRGIGKQFVQHFDVKHVWSTAKGFRKAPDLECAH